MQIATIVPTKYLELVKNDSYHLCLIQELQRDKKYKEFYRAMASKDDGFVIVDNGAAEKHTSTIEEIYDMAIEIGAQELQLPDVFFDSLKTLSLSAKALNYVMQKGWQGSIMVVPQGRNIEEWSKCAETMLQWELKLTIGIPKNLVHTMGPMGRGAAIEAIANISRSSNIITPDIHLLGCWVTPEEIGELYHIYEDAIRGVDSGIATIYTQEGLPLDPNNFGKPRKIVDFQRTDLDEFLLERNIHIWREMCYGKV